MDLSTDELYSRISNILGEVNDVYKRLEALPKTEGKKTASLIRKIDNKPVEIDAIKVNLKQRKVQIPDQVQNQINQIETTLAEIQSLRGKAPVMLSESVIAELSSVNTAVPVSIQPGNNNHNHHNGHKPGRKIDYSAPVNGDAMTKFSSNILMTVGILLTIGITVFITNGDAKVSVYVVGGILSIFMAVFIFLAPELGGYLLIITTISNLSDLFTESGLPSLNQPLVVLILFCILANQFLRTGRVNFVIQLTKTEWALVIFYVILILTVFVASDRSNAISQINSFTRNLVILYCIIASLNGTKKWKKGIWVAIITATILSSMGVYQMMTGNTTFTFWGLAKPSILGQYTDEGLLRYGGPIGESNMWAQTLTAVLCLAIYRIFDERNLRIKYFAGIASLLIAGAIFYTYSRGAFVTAVMIVALIALERRVGFTKILIVIGVGSVFLAFLPQTYLSRIATLLDIVNPHNQYSVSSDESIMGRSTVMKVGLSMFEEHPFLGVGVGNYQDQYWDYAPKLGLESGTLSTSESTNSRQPHNMYIELMAETGVFGFAFFILFIYTLLKALSGIRLELWSPEGPKDRSAWVAAIIMALWSYLISGLFLHGVFYRNLWIFIAMAMAGLHVFYHQKLYSTESEENI
jgi:O-antigen ligase